MKELTPIQAQQRLENLCVRAEHCESELRDKLWRWGILGDEAEAIIDDMRSNRFVDDSRFAGAFVCDKFQNQRWGRVKIAQALRQKRIDRDIIANALLQIDEEEYLQALKKILVAKSRQISDQVHSQPWRLKLYRFALQRGFESSLISTLLS